jgi:hypothetical protein
LQRCRAGNEFDILNSSEVTHIVSDRAVNILLDYEQNVVSKLPSSHRSVINTQDSTHHAAAFFLAMQDEKVSKYFRMDVFVLYMQLFVYLVGKNVYILLVYM